MSFQARMIRTALKLTPHGLVCWVANRALKGIATLKSFDLDLDARRFHVQTHLAGEPEPIEVRVEGFALLRDGAECRFIVERASSNRLWLNNLLAKVTGKAWKIPVPEGQAARVALAAELLGPRPPQA